MVDGQMKSLKFMQYFICTSLSVHTSNVVGQWIDEIVKINGFFLLIVWSMVNGQMHKNLWICLPHHVYSHGQWTDEIVKIYGFHLFICLLTPAMLDVQ